MTSNPNPKPSVSKLTTTNQSAPIPTTTYAPSVPISVYRQLAAELQATRVMLDSLNAQNQQLAQQNQQLRREIDKVAQSVRYLQQVADSSSTTWGNLPYSHPELKAEPGYPPGGSSRPLSWGSRPASGANPSNPAVDVTNVFRDGESTGGFLPDKLVREQAEGRYRQRRQLERGSDVNGWWYTLMVVLIVITAFGAGFLIMRPLLSRR